MTPLALSPGTRLGVYEVTVQIGKGGMGEVYRARDTTLGRNVALKILPAAFAGDPDRLARFTREAQTLAALNHPNIAHIHGLEESKGIRALVMELVDGEDLSQRIEHRPIPLVQALPIARQIADALDAAHERGIVHRDLKPANIVITPDGAVKVLDFGLAKVESSNASLSREQDLTHSPTIMAPTIDGVLLGTAPYMSPEQARGKAVDKRTDIWAFGCVLYEMLTGQRAFGGETTSDSIAAILERDPDWTKLPTATPPRIARLLARALHKDPKRRLRDIADAFADLEDVSDGRDAPRPVVTGRRLSNAIAVGALLIAGGAAISGSLVRRLDRHVEVPEFSRVIRFTSGPAHEVAPVVSPDGKWIAYLSDTGGTNNAWVKFVAGGEAINLTSSSGLDVGIGTGISGLEVAPDGTRIVLAARPRGSSAAFSTWEIPAPLPGVPRKLLDEGFQGVRWSLDGRQLAFIKAGSASGDALFVADADGNNRRQLVEARDGLHIHWPAWSRDGFIYFLRTFTTVANLDAADIYRIDPRTAAPMEPVVQSTRRALFPLPMADGSGLFYSSDKNSAELRLWWRPSDGGPDREVNVGVGEYAELRASADGKTMACTLYDLRQSIVRIPVSTGAPTSTAVTDGFTGDLDPTISAAGDRLVFSSARDGNRHLWTSRPDGSAPRPLTSGDAFDHRPAFSPDGQRIAFVSDRGGTPAIWTIAADGGTPKKVIDAVSTGGLTWSRDGSRIVYAAGVGAGPGLWSVAANGGQAVRIPTPTFAAEPAWSPTEDVIAYTAIRRDAGPAVTDIAFVDAAGTPRSFGLPPAMGGNGFSNGSLSWAPDGRRLAIVNQQANSFSSIWLIDVRSPTSYQKVRDLSPGPRIRGITWMPDGRSLIVGLHDWTSDIVLLERQR